MGILISSLCSNVVLYVRIVCVKLELDDAIIKDRFTSNIQDQPSQIFRTTKLNDCKNLTFDAVSFFLLND